MFDRTKKSEEMNGEGQLDPRERIQIALVKLQALKEKISELRLQCEEMKEKRSEDKESGMLCAECGKPIEPNQEVEIKDSNGATMRSYHKKCFDGLWQKDFQQPSDT
jgi:hypothetical protein